MKLPAPHWHFLNSICVLAAQPVPHMDRVGEGVERTGWSSCCECHMEWRGHSFTVYLSNIVAIIKHLILLCSMASH